MKRKYTIYYMMALVLLFSSCQLGKHYVRPELNLPQQLDSTEQDTLIFSHKSVESCMRTRKRKTMAETIMIQTGAMKLRQSFHGKWIFGETYVGRKIRVWRIS